MSARRSQWRREEARRRSAALSRYIRRSCPTCQGPRIQWLSLDQAREQLGAEWVREAGAWMGPGDGVEDVWLCADCGDAGAFGRAHDDWLDALDARMSGVRPPV